MEYALWLTALVAIEIVSRYWYAILLGALMLGVGVGAFFARNQ